MPISHDSKWFGVRDAKIRVITADPTGGAATYGPRIDVPGIRSVTLGGDITSNELRGDGIRLDQMSNHGGQTLSFEFAKQSLAIMAALAGGSVTDGGTGGAETATWKFTRNSTIGYFEFEAMTDGVDFVGGDGHIVAYKCTITSFPSMGFAQEDYQTYSVDTALMPLLSTGDIFDVVYNETAVPIPSI